MACFLAGYPVGRVLEVTRRPDQAFAEVVAEPVSSLDRDREVLLVWNEPDEAPPAAEPAAEPAAAARVAELD